MRHRLPAAIDDTLAEAVGLESLDELRQEIRQRMQRDYDNVARQRLKRALLDKLAEAVRFPGPARHGRHGVRDDLEQYEAEREARRQIAARAAENRSEAEMPPAGGEPADAGPIDAGNVIAPEETALEGASDRAPPTAEATKPAEHETEWRVTTRSRIRGPAASRSMRRRSSRRRKPRSKALPTRNRRPQQTEEDEKNRQEFRRIAERRVRLGLLLAEVGRNNNIQVSQEELNQALVTGSAAPSRLRAAGLRLLPPELRCPEQSRAPIFEDKVVDFIVELAKAGRAQRHSAGAAGRRPDTEDDEETGPA